MRATDIILNSEMCRQAARNIYPHNPDELFNDTWLRIREYELRHPEWIPDHPKYYFIRAMKNTLKNWYIKEQRRIKHEPNYIEPEEPYGIEYEQFMIEWVNSKPRDENDRFLKNILTLVLYCDNIEDAVEASEMGRTSFWKFRKLAEQKLKDDYNATNIYDFPGDFMV